MLTPRFLPAAAAAAALLAAAPVFAQPAAAPAAAASPFEPLIVDVPASANTLAMINVQKAFASPVAQKLGWATQFRDRFKSGMGSIPPDARLVVVASETNLRDMSRDWQVAFSRIPGVPDMQALAAREGGSTDTIENRPAVFSPRDVIFLRLTGQDLAAVYPANRQALVRWLRAAPRVASPAPGTKPVMSTYLQQAAARGANSDFVAALDTSDAFDRTTVRRSLAASTVLPGKNLNLDFLATVITNMRGLTLTVDLADKINGTLRVDLQNFPDNIRSVAKELLIEALEAEGAAVPELRDWALTTDGYAVVLKGELSPASLSRIMNLFAFPHGHDEHAAAPGADNAPSVPATQRYLRAVTALLDEVRDLRSTPDYDKTSAWHEATARKIEQMATVGVDPDAVAFARQAAASLRAIGTSLRGVPLSLDALGRGGYALVTASRGGGWGWWGWGGGGGSMSTNTNLPQIASQMGDVIKADAQKRNQVWSQIDQGMADLRIKLTDRYKTQF